MTKTILITGASSGLGVGVLLKHAPIRKLI